MSDIEETPRWWATEEGKTHLSALCHYRWAQARSQGVLSLFFQPEEKPKPKKGGRR